MTGANLKKKVTYNGYENNVTPISQIWRSTNSSNVAFAHDKTVIGKAC